MIKLFITLIIASALVGGYVYLTSHGRQVGDPVLSMTPETSVSPSGESTTLKDGTYALVTASSSMEWEGRKTLLANYVDHGTIKIKEGGAVVKGGAVTSGSVVVDMTTLHTISTGLGTGESTQEHHLKSADFFDVEKYPTSTFAFDRMVASGSSGHYAVSGSMTIKGVTQPIQFPATLSLTGDTLTMKASVVLDRTRWGLKYASGKFFKELGDKIIDDNFTVSFIAVGVLAK